jgi:hypothetical protein
MFLRSALSIHGSDMASVSEFYELSSRLLYLPAMVTLAHSGRGLCLPGSGFSVTVPPDFDDLFSAIGSSTKVGRKRGGVGISVSRFCSRR